ncbi:hypothetical protein ID866_7175 [Astraeus odoratus]|nr:hypothetical protein ID866_7175 [Astraeus odoratus]
MYSTIEDDRLRTVVKRFTNTHMTDKHQLDVVDENDGTVSPQDAPRVVLTSKQKSRLWRKVDARLMPIIAIMYLFSFMDRGKLFFSRRGHSLRKREAGWIDDATGAYWKPIQCCSGEFMA